MYLAERLNNANPSCGFAMALSFSDEIRLTVSQQGGETGVFRRIAGFVLLGVLALIVVVIFRTLTFGAPSSNVYAVEFLETPAFELDDAARHLSEAIQYRTVTLKDGDPAPGQAGPWEELHVWMSVTYPGVHAAMTRYHVADYSVLFEWTGSDPSLDPIVLMAHQDVVPVNFGTLEDWEGAPFAGEIIDGVIYGRGALDDKGSLVAIMEACEALIKSGFKPKRTVFLMFGHDEEVSGSGAETMVELLYDRGVRAEMVLDEGFFVISDSPLTGKPFGFIGVSEKGYVTLRITAHADGGHSSTPPPDSANVQLARAIVALEEHQMKADFTKAPVSDLFEAAAVDMSFLNRMALANMWLFGGMVEGRLSAEGGSNAMIRTTTAPTILEGSVKENVLPQRATALVNFRIHPNDTAEDVLAHVKQVTRDIDGLEIVVNGGGIGSEASPVSPSDNMPFAVLSSVAATVGGGDVATGPALVLGGTDARFASKISDNVYRFQPSFVSLDEVAGFHGTNERLSVENMGRMVEGYAQIIMSMDVIETPSN